MSKFKIGDALNISYYHSQNSWYSDDIYYLQKYIFAGEFYNGKIYSSINDLLLLRTISGLELVAHESKFVYADMAIARNERIDYLID